MNRKNIYFLVREGLIDLKISRSFIEAATNKMRIYVNASPHLKANEITVDILEVAAADIQKTIDALEDLLR